MSTENNIGGSTPPRPPLFQTTGLTVPNPTAKSNAPAVPPAPNATKAESTPAPVNEKPALPKKPATPPNLMKTQGLVPPKPKTTVETVGVPPPVPNKVNVDSNIKSVPIPPPKPQAKADEGAPEKTVIAKPGFSLKSNNTANDAAATVVKKPATPPPTPAAAPTTSEAEKTVIAKPTLKTNDAAKTVIARPQSAANPAGKTVVAKPASLSGTRTAIANNAGRTAIAKPVNPSNTRPAPASRPAARPPVQPIVEEEEGDEVGGLFTLTTFVGVAIAVALTVVTYLSWVALHKPTL